MIIISNFKLPKRRHLRHFTDECFKPVLITKSKFSPEKKWNISISNSSLLWNLEIHNFDSNHFFFYRWKKINVFWFIQEIKSQITFMWKILFLTVINSRIDNLFLTKKQWFFPNQDNPLSPRRIILMGIYLLYNYDIPPNFIDFFM